MSTRTLLPSIESCALLAFLMPMQAAGDVEFRKLADTYVEAIADVNEAHVKKPTATDEAMLSKKFPKAASDALDRLLSFKTDAAAPELARCGEAALDLDRVADFERVRAKLSQIAPKEAARIGILISRPRFLMRGLDGVEMEGLTAVADVFDEVLNGYDEVFGFKEWSKVPKKKLRVRVHLVPKIEAPPHFAPEFPWHSEIDFPVVNAKDFESPTPDGKMMLYGLCHELGHVIAMWGDARHEEDLHQWAHYTGAVIVEHLDGKRDVPALRKMRDARWRALGLDRTRLAEAKVRANRDDKDGVLALLVAVHDLVGPRAIGDALNALDLEGRHLRINRVRYYGFDAFLKALLVTDAGKKKAQALRALFE